MDKVLVVIISFVTALIQAVFGGHKNLPKVEVATSSGTVASVSGEQKVTPPREPVSESTEKEPEREEPKVTPPIRVSQTNINMNDLRYPNSTINSEGGGALALSSSDSPDTITNWYKDKLKALNYNVNSFVTTTANDKVENKLVSANGATKVSVEISRDSGQATVNISVTVSSST